MQQCDLAFSLEPAYNDRLTAHGGGVVVVGVFVRNEHQVGRKLRILIAYLLTEWIDHNMQIPISLDRDHRLPPPSHGNRFAGIGCRHRRQTKRKNPCAQFAKRISL